MLIRRQVFFSEIDENGEERLYSVNEKDNSKRNAAIAGGVGLAGTAAGIGLSNKKITNQTKGRFKNSLKNINSREANELSLNKIFTPNKEKTVEQFKKTPNLSSVSGQVGNHKFKIDRNNVDSFDYKGLKSKVDAGTKNLHNKLRKESKEGFRKLAKTQKIKSAKKIGAIGLAATGALAAGTYYASKKKDKK